ncbi:MAG TPA: hypothetical protein VHC63_02430 [Acidimicrobiales bacterium]|nr:hypothetical protein [Acidimicrobiales bacterium]
MAASVRLCVLSLSERSPDGDDAAYLAWHSLDHLPEQYSMRSLVLGQRWVSTPECRSARATGDGSLDAADHVVQYLFADKGSLERFFTLGAELREAGRMPLRLPPVELAGYAFAGATSAVVRPEVLPFRPNRGAYLIVSDEPVAVPALDGVAGVWRYIGARFHERLVDTTGRHLTVCYLDGDPVAVGAALSDALTQPVRFAAPFVSLTPFDWTRSLP